MLVYFLKAQAKIADQPGMMLYGNPPRWHKFNPAVHTDASQIHYHAKKTTEIAAAKEAAKGWTKEHDSQSPEQHIAAMKDKAQAIQAKASASAAITGWKQALLAGKAPTASQAKAAAELAATNPTKAQAVLKEVIDAIGADKAQALINAGHAQAHKQTAQEAQAAVATKDAALQEAIDHLEEDSGQGDLPKAEQQEDAALVDKLKAAVGKPKAKAQPKTTPDANATVQPAAPPTSPDTSPPQPKHTFTSSYWGLEAYVTPGIGPSQGKWRVTLKDTDADEMVPAVLLFDDEQTAIAKAKEMVKVDQSNKTDKLEAAIQDAQVDPDATVAPAPAAPAPAPTKAPLDTAKDVLLAELSTLKLPATNTNAKAVNGKIAKLEALVQAGDHAALTSEKFGSNNYQKKLAKFAAKAASALEGAKQPAAAGADPDGDWLTELFGPEPAPQTVTVNGQKLTKVATGWEGDHHQVYWPGSSQYVAAELIATGTVDAQALGGMGFQKKAQAVSMAVDQGVDPKKALNKIMAVSDPLDGPFEGDTHTLNGVTYVLQNGRWHRQFPAEEQPGVTQEMKDAAVEAVYVSKDTWEDIKTGWLDSLSSGAVPTLAQAGSFEVLNPSEQQQVLTNLVGHYAYKLTPDQSMALVKEAHDAGFPNSFAYLADKFMALHNKALQQGAAASVPAAAAPITVTIGFFQFTKTNGVWKGASGEEYGPDSISYLTADLHAGLQPDPAALKSHDLSTLCMLVSSLSQGHSDPAKLLNAVFPNGGVNGDYGEGAVFTVGLQDFVLKNGKWQEKTDDAPALDANLPGPAAPGYSWEGGSPDTPDLPGWYAAMLAGKTPTKTQHQAFMAFMGKHPMNAVTLKTTLQNTIGLAQYAAQLKPFSPSQYTQAEKDDILQDWVNSITHGKQPTAKMALIYDALNDGGQQYWADMAIMDLVDPDDTVAVDQALEKVKSLQNAALGLPTTGQGGQPAPASAPKTLQFDGITYTKTPQGTWTTAFGDVDSTKPMWLTLEVLAGNKVPASEHDTHGYSWHEEALQNLVQAGKKPEEALDAVYPNKNNLLDWPNEGDTKTINGKTYILHNGRWHLMTPTGGGTTDDFSKHLNKLSTMGYTAALMNGKVPTKAQHQAYLDALTAASNAGHNIQQLVNGHNDLINATIGKQAHDDLKLQMHAEHNTVVSPAAPTVVLTQPLTAEPDDSESWAFDTSMQMGSNHGGLYTDKNGQQWYVKVPKSEAHARNELLAAKLYEAAGVAVPTLKLVKSGGKVAIASQWVDGMQKVGAGIKSATGALEGFAVDAWLANYDSVGTGYDNLLKDKDGKAVRIDVGGSLLFRAQGALKTDFGDQVNELQSMLNPSINSYSAAVFGGISDDQIKAGVAKVAAITPDQIKQMVQQYGPGTAAEKAALADKIIARRTDLLKKHPVAPAKPAQPAMTSAPADTSWHQAIKDGLDAVLPAKNNIKYKSTAAKVEKFKKLLDAQDYATIANTEWGKISYGFQIQLLAKKVAKQTSMPVPTVVQAGTGQLAVKVADGSKWTSNGKGIYTDQVGNKWDVLASENVSRDFLYYKLKATFGLGPEHSKLVNIGGQIVIARRGKINQAPGGSMVDAFLGNQELPDTLDADKRAFLEQIGKLKPGQIDELANKIDPGLASVADKLKTWRATNLAKYGLVDPWNKPPPDETKLVIGNASLTAPIDFFHHPEKNGGPLSSVDWVNQKNTEDSQALFEFAMQGNLKALKDYHYEAVDKNTGQSLGLKPIADHPSNHIKKQWVSYVETLQSIANPPVDGLTLPSLGELGSIEEISEAAGFADPEQTAATVSQEKNLHFFIHLGKVDGVADLVKSIKWKWNKKSDSKFTSMLQSAYSKLSKHMKNYISAVQASGAINHVWSFGTHPDQYGVDLPKQTLAALIYQEGLEMEEGTQTFRWLNDTSSGKWMSKKLLQCGEGDVLQNTDSMCASFQEHWGNSPQFGSHIRMRMRCLKGAKMTPSWGSGGFNSEGELTTLPGQRFVVLSSKKGIPGNPDGVDLDVLVLPPHDGFVAKLLDLKKLGKAFNKIMFFRRAA